MEGDPSAGPLGLGFETRDEWAMCLLLCVLAAGLAVSIVWPTAGASIDVFTSGVEVAIESFREVTGRV